MRPALPPRVEQRSQALDATDRRVACISREVAVLALYENPNITRSAKWTLN